MLTLFLFLMSVLSVHGTLPCPGPAIFPGPSFGMARDGDDGDGVGTAGVGAVVGDAHVGGAGVLLMILLVLWWW